MHALHSRILILCIFLTFILYFVGKKNRNTTVMLSLIRKGTANLLTKTYPNLSSARITQKRSNDCIQAVSRTEISCSSLFPTHTCRTYMSVVASNYVCGAPLFRNITFVNLKHLQGSTHSLLPVLSVQSRSYKSAVALRKRCEHCYFVRRKGQWFVECKTKPRHRQRQKIPKSKIFTED